MSEFKFNRSAALLVKPDTSIAECVRAMRDHGFGAVLVSEPYKNNKETQITGIFTERDLLKWIDEIQKGGFWEKPVFLLMSKPVHTITLDELDQAPELMLTLKVRHLPLVHTDKSTGETIVSMISMRDVLRNHLNGTASNVKAIPREIRVGMIAESKGMRDLIRELCAQRGNATVEIADAEKDIADLDYLFYDLDKVDSKKWTKHLKKINASQQHPKTILIYTPLLHSDLVLETLTKLGLSGRFSVHMKPLNLYLIINQLT